MFIEAYSATYSSQECKNLTDISKNRLKTDYPWIYCIGFNTNYYKRVHYEPCLQI